jgi:hypothetical protein
MIVINGKDVSRLLIGNREVSTQDAVWIPSTNESLTEDNLLFIEEIKESAVGKKFMSRFVFGPNFDLIEATMYKLHPDAPFVTTGRLLDAMKTLMIGAPDKLIPKVVPVTTPPAESVPTDKNGRKLSASQIQWGEFTRWSETASTSERKERQRKDPAYAAFVQKQWGLRLNENPVDGDMTPFNPHLRPKQELSNDAIRGAAAKASLLLPQLEAWVIEYNKTPAARVRALRSPASNPIGHEKYNQAFEAAINAGLI